MTLTKNLIYQGPDMPGETVCPASLNGRFNIRRINATADVSDLLVAGVLGYLTATTNASDITPTSAVYGDDAREGILFVTEIQQANPYFPTTTDRAVYPNRVPNTTCTITDYSHAQNTNIVIIPLEVGMYVWLIGSVDGTFDTTFGYGYVSAANGLIAAVGDPDGIAIDISCHYFTSIATTLNQNWALFRYDGKVAFDKTA